MPVFVSYIKGIGEAIKNVVLVLLLSELIERALPREFPATLCVKDVLSSLVKLSHILTNSGFFASSVGMQFYYGDMSHIHLLQEERDPEAQGLLIAYRFNTYEGGTNLEGHSDSLLDNLRWVFELSIHSHGIATVIELLEACYDVVV